MSLSYTTTSRPEDEPLCLAPILGKNATDFVDMSQEDGLIKLFQSLEEVPLSMLFDLREKVGVAGFRWMPRTLLWERGATISAGGGVAVRRDLRGMYATLSAIKLDLTRLPSTYNCDSVTFRFGNKVCVAWLGVNGSWLPFVSHNTVILMRQPLEKEDHFPIFGVMVAINSFSGGTTYTSWLTHVHINNFDGSRPPGPRPGAMQIQGGNYWKQAQWCIG